MKTWKKVLIGVGAALMLGIIVAVTVYQSRKNLVTVQTGKVQKQNLASVVSASGEIKPKTYANIGANAMGRIVKLHVKEGDRVKKGQLLAQLENVQSLADVNATRASVQAAQTDAVAADAALNTSLADLNRAKSDAVHAKLDWDRAQGLYNAALIAKQDYDVKKAAWESADAGLAQAEAKVAQARAQKDSADKRITQNQANLTRFTDVLQKTTYEAPFDGVITNLPVREGETVVMGIQNSPGSTLMTIADMSVITSEVKVDETDIVNVHLGQPADVTIDAIPHKVFHGVVSEIGDNAIVRSTGVATSQATSTSEEAKDFKVVRPPSCAQASPRPPRSRPRPVAAFSAFRFRRSPSAPRQISCPRIRIKTRGKAIIMCRRPALRRKPRSRRKKCRACSRFATRKPYSFLSIPASAAPRISRSPRACKRVTK
jgi:HlyD family secretion protein